MELTILQWIFQSIPESLAIACLALALSSQKIEFKKVFLIGLPFAVIVFLVRLLPLSFGVHFIIYIVFLSILLNGIIKIRISRSLLTSLVTLIILASFETAIVTLIYSITGIPFEEVRDNLFMWIVYGWPHIILLFLLAKAIDWRRKNRHVKQEGYDA